MFYLWHRFLHSVMYFVVIILYSLFRQLRALGAIRMHGPVLGNWLNTSYRLTMVSGKTGHTISRRRSRRIQTDVQIRADGSDWIAQNTNNIHRQADKGTSRRTQAHKAIHRHNKHCILHSIRTWWRRFLIQLLFLTFQWTGSFQYYSQIRRDRSVR